MNKNTKYGEHLIVLLNNGKTNITKKRVNINEQLIYKANK